MKTFANTGHFFLLTGIMLIVGACDAYYIFNKKWLMGGVFLLLILLHFFLIFTDCGMFVELNRSGVLRRSLGHQSLEIGWDEIAEWGIVCPNLFPGIGKKIGTKYLYFSRNAMSESERLEMCFHWPPKNKIYVSYSPKRLRYILEHKQIEPIYYNAEKTEVRF